MFSLDLAPSVPHLDVVDPQKHPRSRGERQNRGARRVVGLSGSEPRRVGFAAEVRGGPLLHGGLFFDDARHVALLNARGGAW